MSAEADPNFSGSVHGTSVVIDGRAVLIRGTSGAGKSDLALRVIDRGAVLLADDYTHLAREQDTVIGSAPERTAGLMEVRGLGLVSMPHVARARVALVVQADKTAPERYPDPLPTCTYCGLAVPMLTLNPFEASAPLKIELALRHISRQTVGWEPMR
ncbi:HPr kinase/phosphatase C-terminal domain-containing protein [Sphingobium sp. DEHP117]|uniref:HPr kinase/phosphorylase n=1 Tax=Sphingobium sp. DEHP117 TaxID=2993436 RepID=UPI0027D54A72|nr:HPr kinase/phosphatase C-terminal domain-containing protein [Sphingobium sp. DEHP117]MDQ4419724.1 HPr kinase/phosphatase C-terminal domain-containing protein [Sphingobium sp. DEHP117]